jgi:GNAT superfamily N-acetyltransferase
MPQAGPASGPASDVAQHRRTAISVHFVVTRVPAEVTFPLRHQVLGRHAHPAELARPDDDAPDSGHFVIRDGSDEVLATGTVRRQSAPPPLRGDVGWQIRGMAVVEGQRGMGLGTQILSALVEHVARNGGGLMWCRARVLAVSLYERSGFKAHGDPVEDEVAGLQVLMARVVTALDL